MPIRKVDGGYKWGGHGKIYPTRAGAERQAAAAHANGFKGDSLTAKGQKILSHMEKEYGGVKPGKRVLYASKNAGRITGIDTLNRAIAAGERELEAQKQTKALLDGKHVSGRDRARLKR
jgi:hypothetical protein